MKTTYFKEKRYWSKHRILNKLANINIGNDVYLVGNLNKAKRHRVIYGSNKKQYHLYNDDAENLESYNGYKDQSYIDPAKAKIYILTNILDSKENWEFDLSKIPSNGNLKVIYTNGTIKNVNFQGSFEDVELIEYSLSIGTSKDVELSKSVYQYKQLREFGDERSLKRHFYFYKVRNESEIHPKEVEYQENYEKYKSKFSFVEKDFLNEYNKYTVIGYRKISVKQD